MRSPVRGRRWGIPLLAALLALRTGTAEEAAAAEAPDVRVGSAAFLRLPDGGRIVRIEGAGDLRPERLRLFADLDGPEKGCASEGGADVLIAGDTLYRCPERATGWAWDAAGGIAWVRGAAALTGLLPEDAAWPAWRWWVRVVDASGAAVGRFPEAGALDASSDALAPWAATRPDAPTSMPAWPGTERRPLSLRFQEEWDARTGSPETARGGALGWTPPGRADSVPIQIEIVDAAKGTASRCEPDRVERTPASVKWSGATADGVRWRAIFDLAPDGDLRVLGEVSSDRDRALSVGVLAELDLAGWVWHDDLRASRPVEPGAVYSRTFAVPCGAHGQQSVYPFGAASSASEILVAEVDPSEPRVFQIRADSGRRAFGAWFDLAPSSQTAQFPRRATFAAAFRRRDAAEGPPFRVAAATFFERHPELDRAPAVPLGPWLSCPDPIRLRALADWGPSVAEVPASSLTDPPPGDSLRARLSMVAPFVLSIPLPAGGPVTRAEALRVLRFHEAVGEGPHAAAAAAAGVGALRTESGALRFDLATGRSGAAARFWLSLDPDLMTTADVRFNRAMIEWNWARYALGRDDVRGLSVSDAPGADLLDYSPAAMAAADHPCTFDAAARRPAVFAPCGAMEYLAPLRRFCRDGGRTMVLREPDPRWPFYDLHADAVVDVAPAAGDRGAWAASARRLAARRVLAGRRPAGLVLDEDPASLGEDELRAYFEACLFWGFLPGDGRRAASAVALPADPESAQARLPRTWVPLAARLASAGWRPMGLARPAPEMAPALQIENFGPSADGIAHVALRNAGAEPAAARLAIAGAGDAPLLLLNPFDGRCETVVGGGGDRAADVRVEGGRVDAWDLVPASALDAELAFLDGWRSGHGEAGAGARNVRAVRAEWAAAAIVRLAPAGTPLRGRTNALAVIVRNIGDGPLVVSGVRLRSPAAPRLLASAPQVVAPGAEVAIEGGYGEGDVDADGWLEAEWTLRRTGVEAAGSRAIRLRFLEPVEIALETASRVAVGTECEVTGLVRNREPVAREVDVLWTGDFWRDSRRVSLPPEGAAPVTFKVSASRATRGNMTAVVLDGNRELARRSMRLTFLPDRASPLRDSRTTIEVDSVARRHRAAALADGLLAADAAESAALTWASEDTAEPHRVRFTLPPGVSLRGLSFHWPAEEGIPQSPRELRVRGWTADGREMLSQVVRPAEGEPITVASFRPLELAALEIVQPARMGPKRHPDRMWLTEIEGRR